MHRRPRSEIALFAVIALGLVGMCGLLGLLATLSETNAAKKEPRRSGEPVEVTGQVPASLLLGPADAPTRGAPKARFTLVEFGDFECRSCARAQPALRDLLQRRRSDLRLVFRHCPLIDLHPAALAAARLAEAARRQNRFWEIHDALYKQQATWPTARDVNAALHAVAASGGLDPKVLPADLHAARSSASGGDLDRRIEADMEAAGDASVNTTPAFFLITPTRRVWVAVGPVGLQHLRDGEKYWR